MMDLESKVLDILVDKYEFEPNDVEVSVNANIILIVVPSKYMSFRLLVTGDIYEMLLEETGMEDSIYVQYTDEKLQR